MSVVEEGGPAARAGVQPGDVVIEYNGKGINRKRRALKQLAVDDVALLLISRNGREIFLPVTRAE